MFSPWAQEWLCSEAVTSTFVSIKRDQPPNAAVVPGLKDPSFATITSLLRSSEQNCKCSQASKEVWKHLRSGWRTDLINTEIVGLSATYVLAGGNTIAMKALPCGDGECGRLCTRQEDTWEYIKRVAPSMCGTRSRTASLTAYLVLWSQVR